ncbi:SRPBCC family protein [Gordonia sp. Z-3]|jgi:ribosome-associated toxin RatA of RatAB toxin-antitoxin module|uniref:SRPBCC family protein n=2 Tax=Gordonia TaxID=2053 RepID=A0A9X3I3P5_9ACTN|nr:MULTISPECIES: SRPBCC family protein [Gordonia]MCK5754635.1 SRPBCC family protein [Mycobacterium sp.]MAU81178.1 cyclase [Gordonia sp. (in: high G+C Gram-positive bacteria)]MCF3938502.1 SRPBCC family protein [Gordonia tangerina]MCX2963853.1 SRPBCC family protein [Gordonia aquimaris]MED5801548.1 SRPBCC family protein [Gordonia sp. Z-3]
MADHTERSIVINADASDIMAVIADFDHYPDWVSAAREVEVIETGVDGRPRVVRFVLDAGVLQDTYVLSYDWGADDRTVAWTLVSSDLQRDQRGRYVLSQQVPGSTKVTYELMVDLLVPMIGQLKRRAEKAITEAALNDLKKRVEG